MSLPLTALSDDEVSHYAAFDDDVAQELARRNQRYSTGYIAQIEKLQRELEWSEREREDLETQVNDHEALQWSMEKAAEYIRRALNSDDRAELEDVLKLALEELEQ
jgi:hypothetical protein